MRSPVIASFLLLLTATFGFVAQAADSAADLSVQLGIIANNSTSQAAGTTQPSTMMLNGVVYAVQVTKDKDGKLSVKPVESNKSGEIITIVDGKQVSVAAGGFPKSIAFTTATTAGGGISVTQMTVNTPAGETVLTANTAGGFASAGPALTLVAVEGTATTTTTTTESKSVDGKVVSKVIVTSTTGTAYTPTAIVIIYAGTTNVAPGDAKNNPSPN